MVVETKTPTHHISHMVPPHLNHILNNLNMVKTTPPILLLQITPKTPTHHRTFNHHMAHRVLLQHTLQVPTELLPSNLPMDKTPTLLQMIHTETNN